MLIIQRSTKFKKDYKKIIDENLKIELRKVLELLQNNQNLPEKYLDHQLKWDYKYFRECHIKPNLLLIYSIDKNKLILYVLRLWSHSDIF